MNVAGLYGFFRPGPVEPKDLFSRWPAVLAALLLIVAVGYVAVLRDAARRREGLAILAAGVAGYFLALGSQGPTGGLFRLAYGHVPGFVMMREPEKFAVLVALAYAYGFGWGIAWLTTGEPTEGRPGRARRTGDCLASCLHAEPARRSRRPGQRPARFPSSWSVASRLAGQNTVLFLPWHEYFPTPFTGQRAIANPAAFYFAGTVLTSQNPGGGYAFAAEDPEHVFLDKLLGPPVDVERLRVALAGLGVRFVALAKVADWRDFARWQTRPGSVWCTRAPRWTCSLSSRPPRSTAMAAGCGPLTSPTTGSFPVVRVLSRCLSPTRGDGRSTAILRYGSPTGRPLSSRQQQEVSFIIARPTVLSLARLGLWPRPWLSQASHSSSAGSGDVAVLAP